MFMKTILFIVTVVIFISGCTTLRRPVTVPNASGIEQDLRYQAVEKACDLITNKHSRLEEITKLIIMKEKEIDNFTKKDASNHSSGHKYIIEVLRESISELTNEMEMKARVTQNIESLVQRLKPNKLCVEILGDYDRQYIYRYIIEKELRKNELTNLSEERDADYKLRVVLKKDGVDARDYNCLWLYTTHTLQAEADVVFEFIDIKTNTVIFTETNHGYASYKESYFVGIGPL